MVEIPACGVFSQPDSEEYLASRYLGTHWDPPPSENEIKLAIHATRKLAEKLAPEYFPGDNPRD